MAKQKEKTVKLVIDGIEIRHTTLSIMAQNYAKVENLLAGVSRKEFIDFVSGYLLSRDSMGILDSWVAAVKDLEKTVSGDDFYKALQSELEVDKDAI
jgi:hypothetical protein